VKLGFHGCRIISDAGSLAYRDPDDTPGPRAMAGDVLACGGQDVPESVVAGYRGKVAHFEFHADKAARSCPNRQTTTALFTSTTGSSFGCRLTDNSPGTEEAGMVHSDEIKKYRFLYHGAGTGKRPNGATYSDRAQIALWGENGGLIAVLHFCRDPAFLPDGDTRGSNGIVQSYFLAADFPAVVDLLRNEKPLYLKYDDGANRAWIDSGLEPVGEEE
jgi:hypothetical protein